MTLEDSVLCDIVMAALHSRCGHYILQLWFLLVSFFFSFFFFSRLVSAVSYWMQIQNAGLKCAARGSLKIQDATNRKKFAICAPSHNCRAIPLQLRHVSTPHHNRFMALSPGPLGWAGARRELLDFMVQGKINRGRHTDLSLIHIWRCRRSTLCRSRWSPYH